MKFPGEASERLARELLSRGPSTASDLAVALEMTPAGVRRSLHALTAVGYVAAHDRAPYGPTPKRGRGRPSTVFSLTHAGRAACDQAYDDLALDVLTFMSTTFGPSAVQEFADMRAQRLVMAMPDDASPAELADVLSKAGYAAQIEPLEGAAVQLCQHHCPVVDAAREFPALCEAETTALGKALGRHVTRLATLAQGDEVCTTVIPLSRTSHSERKVSA